MHTTDKLTLESSQNQKIRFYNSIGGQIMIWSLILGLVPLLILGGIAYATSQNALRTATQNQAASAVANKGKEIENWMSDTERMVDTLAHLPTIMGDDDPTTMMGVEDLRQYRNDPNHLNEYRSAYNLASSEIKSFIDKFGRVDAAFLVAADGTILVSTSKLLPEGGDFRKVTPSAQTTFEATMKGTYESDLIMSLDGVTPIFAVFMPIVNSQGKTVGLASMRVNAKRIATLLADAEGLSDSGETYLVNTTNGLMMSQSRFVQENTFLKQVVDTYATQQVKTGISEGSRDYNNYLNTPVVGAWRAVQGRNWVLIGEVSQSAAYVSVVRLAGIMALVIVIAAVCILVVSFLISRTISRPILGLTAATLRIAGGDLSERAPAQSQNEIGVLARMFNTMSDELAKKIGELDQKINEVEATNGALKIATARAKEAARVKGEFLANVSHELRTPLNAIIGFSDMLLTGMTGPLNDKQTHKLQRLKENGSRLLNLINDLLDLTRIESGRLEMVEKAFSPQSLAERMIAQMESLAVESNLKFVTAVSPEVPETVQGDEKRVEQVVVNLLSNAFKFTKEGSVTLSISANHKDKTWSLDVIDTGIGIPPHAMNVIFEEFRQLDGSYSRAYKGSGLGLAITRNLVRMMGGKITVKSTLGNGSTFTVTLPMSIHEHETTESMALEAIAV